MNASRKHKKKLIVSYKNLSEELLELFKEAYPEGYKDYIQKTIKPNGDPIFVVPLETDDTTYMIKIEVKIDSALAADEEMDKDFYGDDDKDMDFDTLDAIDKDSDNTDHTEHHLHHGDYEDAIASSHKIKKNSALSKELDEAFADDDFDDDYDEDKLDDELDEDEADDFEPSMEDLMGIEDEFDSLMPTKGSTKKTSKKAKEAKEPKESKPKAKCRKKKSED